MRIRRPILLAAVASAALAASPALAGDGYDAPIGDAWGDSWESSGEAAGSWEGGYTGEPAYYDEGSAGADYAGGAAYGGSTYVNEPVYGGTPYGGAAVYGGGASYGGSYQYGPAPVGAQGGLPPQPGAQRFGYSDAQRADWLRECRSRYRSDDGLGGAVIGGVIGGVAGNRIAGRGNRVAGTVIGAGVGAIAGAAIDKAEDSGRARDECEDYLARYEASYSGGSAAGYAGYGQNVVWVPMIVGWNCKPRHEVEEWVEEAPARRVIYTKPAPTKVIRTKVIKSTKYSK